MATVLPAPSAIQVGSYFVQQYYQVLQQQPDFVHQFYTDASTMLRVDGNIVESASSMLQIHSLVMSFNFTSIEIKTAHSLDSWNGGVLLMVSGSVQTKDYSGKRKFVETFFLAPQERGYFVLNDIFHFIDEEQIHQHPAVILGGQFDDKLNICSPHPEPDIHEAEFAGPDYIRGEETQSRLFVASCHAEGNEPVDQFNLPEQQQHEVQIQQEVPEAGIIAEGIPIDESKNSFQHMLHPVKESSTILSEEPAVEPPKQTYASILRVAREQSTLPVPLQPSINKSALSASDWHHSQPPTFDQSHHALSMGSERHMTEAVEEITIPEEVEGKSVYVRNLPTSISSYEIEEEFKKFGQIKPEGVIIRSRKDIPSICYAFIEFEDAVGVQNAIKASRIQFCGRQVYIEERRANDTNTSRGGRRGRGRGGSYQLDASRGRSGGRSFGRGSGQDGSGDREFNRPRGNGFYQRGTRQDTRNGPKLSSEMA